MPVGGEGQTRARPSPSLRSEAGALAGEEQLFLGVPCRCLILKQAPGQAGARVKASGKEGCRVTSGS